LHYLQFIYFLLKLTLLSLCIAHVSHSIVDCHIHVLWNVFHVRFANFRFLEFGIGSFDQTVHLMEQLRVRNDSRGKLLADHLDGRLEIVGRKILEQRNDRGVEDTLMTQLLTVDDVDAEVENKGDVPL
jgi:hypothetical protein